MDCEFRLGRNMIQGANTHPKLKLKPPGSGGYEESVFNSPNKIARPGLKGFSKPSHPLRFLRIKRF